MENIFFERPILNSPYEYPSRHWELDAQGQPTQKIIEKRRRAEFITPIPKPKKRKTAAVQQDLVFDEGKGLSTQQQRYDPTPIINDLRKIGCVFFNPNDPDSYYQSRELVPGDMLRDLERAKIVVTNYHAFKLRDRMELSKGGRSLLQGRGGEELKDTRNRRPNDSTEVINLVTLESNLKYSIIILATQWRRNNKPEKK